MNDLDATMAVAAQRERLATYMIDPTRRHRRRAVSLQRIARRRRS